MQIRNKSQLLLYRSGLFPDLKICVFERVCQKISLNNKTEANWLKKYLNQDSNIQSHHKTTSEVKGERSGGGCGCK